MNQHVVPNEPGQYIFAFSLSPTWLRIAGSCAFAAVIIAFVANATEPFRAPLGIALGVLATTLLIAFAVKGSSRRQTQEPAAAQARTGGHRMLLGNMRGRRSLAAEMALLAELHAKGALSDEEFNAAKLRTLAD